MPKSGNPVGPPQLRRSNGQTSGKVFPAPSRPCAPWSANWTPKSKVSVEGEASDQLLQQTAWSKTASRPHTFEVWKVLPTQEGADALPRAAPGALTLPAGDLLLQGL